MEPWSEEEPFSVYEKPTPKGSLLKAWDKGVDFDEETYAQLKNIASLPFIHNHVAAMPDAHVGIGATVGSVIATKGAIIPAAVGVDLGCGMCAWKLSLTASDLPDNLQTVRAAIERAIPHGRTDNGGPNDKGAWRDTPRSPRAERPHVAAGGQVLCLGVLGDDVSVLILETRPAVTRRRSAPATISLSCVSTRRTASGSCCTLVRVASATRSVPTSFALRMK